MTSGISVTLRISRIALALRPLIRAANRNADESSSPEAPRAANDMFGPYAGRAPDSPRMRSTARGGAKRRAEMRRRARHQHPAQHPRRGPNGFDVRRRSALLLRKASAG